MIRPERSQLYLAEFERDPATLTRWERSVVDYAEEIPRWWRGPVDEVERGSSVLAFVRCRAQKINADAVVLAFQAVPEPEACRG